MALKRSYYTFPDTKDNSKDVPSELTDVEVFLKVQRGRAQHLLLGGLEFKSRPDR